MNCHAKPLLISALFLSSGCTVFAPRFDPYVSTQTNAAYSEVALMVSAVELGKYSKPASFDAAIDSYASIDGKLAAASQRASLLDAPTSTSRTARDKLKSLIEGCRTQIRNLAEGHKEAGLPPSAGMTQGVMVSCDTAARAADAMK